MKKHSFLTAFLCLVLIFSMLLVSCSKAPEPSTEPPENTENPDGSVPPNEDDKYIHYIVQKKEEEVPYICNRRPDFWRSYPDVLHWQSTYNTVPYYSKIWEESDYPLEPGDKVVIVEKEEYSDMNVSPAVYDYLESWDISKRQFLISDVYRLFPSTAEKNFEEKCKVYFSDIASVENTGYYLWEGTADELRLVANKLMESGQVDFRVRICFYEDFLDIYGATVEQALALIQNGHFDDMCLPKSESPLYGLTPTQIAAYLAEHPELLEENA